MDRDIVYFDLETQRTANDAGGWHKKGEMKMSIGVTYSTRNSEYRIYQERDVEQLIQQLLQADLVVGFNVISFDYEVLMGYTILDIPNHTRTLDMLVTAEEKLGHRIKLDSLAEASLGVNKTADGMDALKWWKEGRVYDIAEYCCYDVKVTKMVHEYGVDNKKCLYLDKFSQKKSFPVEWSL